MLDIKLIRENPEFVKEKLQLRGEDGTAIQRIESADSERLALLKQSEKLKETKNKVSDEIALMKRNKLDASDAIAKMKSVSEEIKSIDERIKHFDDVIETELQTIPNLPHETVPAGKTADDNIVIREWGEARSFDF